MKGFEQKETDIQSKLRSHILNGTFKSNSQREVRVFERQVVVSEGVV